MDCEQYDNDEVMAALGRDLVDMYINFATNHNWTAEDRSELRGPASYIVAAIGAYVSEENKTEHRYCADCRHHIVWNPDTSNDTEREHAAVQRVSRLFTTEDRIGAKKYQAEIRNVFRRALHRCSFR